MALNAQQLTDLETYANQQLAAFVIEYVNESYMGCTNPNLAKQIVFSYTLKDTVFNNNILDTLTGDERDIVINRLKCVLSYDVQRASAVGINPWLTYDDIPWFTPSGYYWQLP